MLLSNIFVFKHVSYLWDEAKAVTFNDDQVNLLIYRSNLLGADLRLTNYGGGNTSCKVFAKDMFTGKDTEIMWVKASGGDLSSLKKWFNLLIYGSFNSIKKSISWVRI